MKTRQLIRFGLLPCVLVLMIAATLGCARKPEAKRPLLFFPPPPAEPRVQYLGAISSTEDLPSKQSSFGSFILGEEPMRPLAKPINAILAGTRLYICDTVFNTVFVYDLATGEHHALLGDKENGKIRQANNIAVDDTGKFYVADKIREAILVYGPDEQFMAAWGRPGQAQPVAAAIGATEIYVVDIKDHEIEVWDRQSGAYKRTIGRQGSGPGEFISPTYIALDSQGNLYVTDSFNFRVQKLSPEGQHLMTIGSLGRNLGQFAFPKGMDVDDQGRVYVADARFANIQIFDDQGRLLLFFGGPGPNRGNLDLPAGVRVYRWPNIQWLNDRVTSMFTPEYLVVAVSQKGEGYINFYAVGHGPAPQTP